MKSNDSPESWSPPVWHPDFGDPTVELEQLRSLAIDVMRAIPAAQVSLEVPEPGLMMLRIYVPNARSTEVYSVPGLTSDDDRRFALFVSPRSPGEIETYEASVKEAVTFILENCRGK